MFNGAMETLIKSKERVTESGEVFTAKREVNAMLDLVKQETERIESKFLEQACGDGNFLAEILERKLRIVETRYRKSQLEYERNAVSAVSSLYGIDILPDNIEDCRKRLFAIFERAYDRLYPKTAKAECKRAVRFILSLNIICGDALTLKTVGNKHQPIVFPQWSFPFHDSRIKRCDWMYEELMPPDKDDAMNLFAAPPLVSDLGEKVFLPKMLKDYPLVHFMKIGNEHE